MNLLDLIELLEMDNLDIITYTSPLKIVATGKILGFSPASLVIDYGCGRGEALALWGQYFGISGIGIDCDASFCECAQRRFMQQGLAGQLQVVCADATAYPVALGSYDVASCLNASDMWGGFQPTLQHLKSVVKPDGTVIIAEPYFTIPHVPDELREWEGERHTEAEILDIIHAEGCELLFIQRATAEECDIYRSHFRGDLQRIAATHMSTYYRSAIFALQLSR